MRALSITAVAFAAYGLLLPSCVRWHIGENIRECAETRVGVNPAEVYLVGEAQAEKRPPAVATPGIRWDGRVEIAREARYETDTALVTLHPELRFGAYGATAQEVQLTPHYRRVDFVYHKIGGLESKRVGERFDPAGQKMERYTGMQSWHDELNARSMGCAEVERSTWYPLAATLAAPFDYCIDPVLSTASTALFTPVVGTYVLLGVVYDVIAH